MEKQIMWAVHDWKWRVQVYTLDYQRKGAVSKFLAGGKMTWAQCKTYGWTVRKVEVTIKPKP